MEVVGVPWRSKPREDRGEVRTLPLDRIAPNPRQPRRTFDDTEIAELAASIRHLGVLQPIVVRGLGGGQYEIVAGERRYRASRLAGLREIPAVVLDLADEDAALVALVENVQRSDLHPLEEAEALRRLVDTFGLTQEEVARRIGRSQAAVANKLRLLKLDERVKALVAEARIGERHLRALLRLDSGDEQVRLAQAIVEEGLTAHDVEERVEELLAAGARPRETTRGRRVTVLRDVRIFLNSFRHAVRTLAEAGVPAEMVEEDTGEFIEVRVRIPKARARARG